VTRQKSVTDSALQPAPLLAAAQLLADQGIYGLLWLDEDLHIAARYGLQSEHFEVGEHVVSQIPALLGYEPELLTVMASTTGDTFTLPAIKMISQDQADAPRFNITAIAAPAQDALLVLLARVMSQTLTDIELTRAMRARLIAEEELARKSRQLAEANAELALANRDLEDYAAVISHDLKAPLRAIRYLGEDAREDLSAGRIGAVETRLNEIDRTTRRLSRMLSDLLEYACVGRKEDVAEDTDLDRLLDRVFSTIALPPGFRLRREGHWPVLRTPAAAIDMVLRNLIENAIKHHDRQNGVIVVRSHGVRDSFTFDIEDDGPGIEPRHHQAALLPFRTLSTDVRRPRMSGSGMGLAFVKRTLDTVGGTLSIHSERPLARGTRITIDWPLMPKQR